MGWGKTLTFVDGGLITLPPKQAWVNTKPFPGPLIRAKTVIRNGSKHAGSNGARHSEDAKFQLGKGSMQQNQSVRSDSKMGYHCAWGPSVSTTMHVRPTSTIF